MLQNGRFEELPVPSRDEVEHRDQVVEMRHGRAAEGEGLVLSGHRRIRDVDVVDVHLLAQLGGDERLPVAVDVGKAIDEAGRVVEVDEARGTERLGRVVEHRDRLARRAEVDALARDLDVVRRVDRVAHIATRCDPHHLLDETTREQQALVIGRACSRPGARSGGSRGSARRSRSSRARRAPSSECARCPGTESGRYVPLEWPGQTAAGPAAAAAAFARVPRSRRARRSPALGGLILECAHSAALSLTVRSGASLEPRQARRENRRC